MSWGQYLFGFSGRINRAKLWLFVLIAIGVEIVMITLFSIVIGGSVIGMLSNNGGGAAAAAASGGIAVMLLGFLSFAVGIALFVAGLAVTVKRLHDRNKGAVWLLVFWLLPLVLDIIGFAMSAAAMNTQAGQMPQFNPLASIVFLAAGAIGIWAFVELYCLRGTVGDNQFGPDPLAGQM